MKHPLDDWNKLNDYVFPDLTLSIKGIEIFDMGSGGLIGQGELGPDVPLENAEAMLEIFYQSGKLK